MKCTRPDCNCLEKEEQRIGGPVKYGYPCLYGNDNADQIKSKYQPLNVSGWSDERVAAFVEWVTDNWVNYANKYEDPHFRWGPPFPHQNTMLSISTEKLIEKFNEPKPTPSTIQQEGEVKDWKGAFKIAAKAQEETHNLVLRLQHDNSALNEQLQAKEEENKQWDDDRKALDSYRKLYRESQEEIKKLVEAINQARRKIASTTSKDWGDKEQDAMDILAAARQPYQIKKL